MTSHSSLSGVQSMTSKNRQVRSFRSQEIDIDVMLSSLAYHVDERFDLRAKFLLDGSSAADNGSDKGLHGQALESLFGSPRNSDAKADFVDWKDRNFRTEMKLSLADHRPDVGWIPSDKVKLQSQPLDILDTDSAWENFLTKCGHMTLVLRSQPEDPDAGSATGPLGMVYESYLVRAMTIDIKKFSKVTLDRLRDEHRVISELARISYAKFPDNPEKASKHVGVLQSAENKKRKARGEGFLLYLGTSGASGNGNRSWYIRKSAFDYLLKTELGRGIEDCSRGSYSDDDVRFPDAVYSALNGYSEEDIQEFLDPDREVRDNPDFVKTDKPKPAKRIKVDYDQKRMFCESCFTALGLAQEGTLCDSCC